MGGGRNSKSSSERYDEVLASSRTALLRQDRYGDGNQPQATELEDEEDVRRCCVGNGMDIAELPGLEVMSQQLAEYEDIVEVVESWLSVRIIAVEVCLEAAGVC